MAKNKDKDNKTITTGASATTPAQNPAGTAAAVQNQPNIQVIAQYIRDLSFENPNAPESLIGGWGAPETNVQIFLKHAVIKDDTYEVNINLRVEAKKRGEDKVAFIIDLSYGALVILRNIPKENHQPAVLVEVPKLLFPFAREIIASATSQGGYPPLFLTPVSFEAIYISEINRLRAQQQQTAKA